MYSLLSSRHGSWGLSSHHDRHHLKRMSVIADASIIRAERGLYSILGVDPRCESAEIKAAYRKLAKTLHPDVQPAGPERAAAEEQLREANRAYEVLGDERARAQYDTQFRFAQEAGDAYAAAMAAGSGLDPVKLAQLKDKMLAAQDALSQALRARAMAQEARRAAEAARQHAEAVKRQAAGVAGGEQLDLDPALSKATTDKVSGKEALKAAKRQARQEARAGRRQATQVRNWAQWAEFEAAQARLQLRNLQRGSDSEGGNDGSGADSGPDTDPEAELMDLLEEVRAQASQGQKQKASQQHPSSRGTPRGAAPARGAAAQPGQQVQQAQQRGGVEADAHAGGVTSETSLQESEGPGGAMGRGLQGLNDLLDEDGLWPDAGSAVAAGSAQGEAQGSGKQEAEQQRGRGRPSKGTKAGKRGSASRAKSSKGDVWCAW